MKLIKLKFGLLSNEYLEVLKQSKKVFNNHNPTALKLKPEYDGVVAIINELEDSLEKEKGNALTKELNDLDYERDSYFIGFDLYLKSMIRHPEATIRANAAILLKYVEGFGNNIARTNQLSETSILNSIVDGINNDAERKAALISINGTAWIAAIGAKNASFSDKYGQRVVTDTDEKKVESFSSVRKRAQVAFGSLTERLGDRYRTEKADGKDIAAYETCINELNEVFRKANILIESSKPHTPPPATPPNNTSI